MSALLAVLFILVASTNVIWASNHSFPFSTYLDANQQVSLKWSFDNLHGNITFQLAINTTGWLGFGFCPNGSMENADMVIGGQRSNGSYFQDYHATGQTNKPVVDTKQSYTLLSMAESNGQTVMTFWRPMDTCDDEDLPITDQPMHLIYAYGETDEMKYQDGHRGSKLVNLLNYVSQSILPNATYLTVRVENITIPSKKTYYHCKVLKLPDMKTKRQIYQIESDIEHYEFVHHMLLYRCPFFINVSYDAECYKGDIGDYCFEVVASWAVGGGAFQLPENMGIPIGGSDRTASYRLEIHYNNPQMKEGITDNSGLKLYYTDQLRQHDVGILTTGVLPMHPFQYSIPPKASQFHTYGVCNTTYFSRLVNNIPDLQVFAVLLHTHLAGRKVRVGHFRNQQQIDFLGVDEHYNFGMQQIVSLGSIKTLKMGDEIVVECTYNTENRNGTTVIGLSTTDEMCLAFLMYYPAINITSCISHPNMSYLSPPNQQMFETIDSAVLETMYRTIPQVQVISDTNGHFSVDENGFVNELMETPTIVCKNPGTPGNPGNPGNSGNPGHPGHPGHPVSTASRLYTTWIVNTGGLTLLLFWIIM